MRWRVELLGRLRVTEDRATSSPGRDPITRFQTRKTALLLAYLVYYSRRHHPREVLIELFWPESEPSAGRNSLSKALTSLRRQLEPPGVPSGTTILADREFVYLNSTAIVTDVARFETLLDRAAQARAGSACMQWLTEAIALYQGELLSGFHEDWILPERERLADRFHGALSGLIADSEKRGNLSAALQFARQAVSADPLREPAHHAVIRLLIATNQRDAALRHWRELEDLFARELDATPSPETRALLATGTSAEERTRTDRQPPPPPQTTPAELVAAGTVTLLLAEIIGSPSPEIANHHRERLQALLHEHGGRDFTGASDPVQRIYDRASDALAAALAAQRSLASRDRSSEGAATRVRIALHTVELASREPIATSPALQHATRLLFAAHGGQILLSEASAGLLRAVRTPDCRIVELGSYRLHETALPERLFQIQSPVIAPHSFPAPNALPGHPDVLPISFNRFFGREPEIATLQELLRSRDVRLVTLTGPGGSGKTRLAAEAATHLRRPMAEDVSEELFAAIYFVRLVDLTSVRQIPDRLLDVLCLTRIGQIDPLEQTISHLTAITSSTRRVLLILDNFEHLADDGASVACDLLERVPAVCILVTSRQLLGLPGERDYPVAPLPVPSDFRLPIANTPIDGSDLQSLLECPSVQLFVDRARAVRPDFQVTPANRDALSTLCDRLEGLPLAIELAAARAGVMTPARMVTELDHRFDLLVTRRRGGDPRHVSLRTAIDWSYQLLTPNLKRFFVQLSVFRGGWTVSAAAAVCESHNALDSVEELCRCSLVLVEESHGEMRFRMLETVREFAATQLTDAERDECQCRHAAYYLTLVGEENERRSWSKETRASILQLEQETGNLQAALQWGTSPLNPPLTETSERGITALRLAGGLGWFWYFRGHFHEAQHWFTETLARAGDDAPPCARARVLMNCGRVAWQQGEQATALTLLGKSLNLARKIDHHDLIVLCLMNLGVVERNQEHWEEARVLFSETIDRCRAAGDDWGLGVTLGLLGVSERLQGNLEPAHALLEEGLRVLRAAGNPGTGIFLLVNLAELEETRGDELRAAALYRESLLLYQETGYTLTINRAVAALARTIARAGWTPATVRIFSAGIARAEALGLVSDAESRAEHERANAAASTALGAAVFARAWIEGQQMPIDQAVAEVLEASAGLGEGDL